jgi:diguanylate cyclase (GGDEF)-like protein/PAS domain S-box-containing protein
VFTQALGGYLMRPGESFATRVEADRLRTLYRALPISLLTSIVNAVVLGAVQSAVVALPTVIAWTGAVVLLSLWRIHGYRRFMRQPPATPGALAGYKRRFLAEVLASGVLWGAAGIFLYPPHDSLHQMFVVFMLAGMSAGAITTLSPIWRASLAYLVPALLPLTVMLFAGGTALSVPMGLMVLLFLSMVSLASLRSRNNLVELLHARYAQEQADADLRLAATTFRSQEGILIADSTGVVLRLNDAGSRMTGYGADTLAGVHARTLLETDETRAATAEEEMASALAQGGFWAGECNVRTHEGKRIPVRATVTAVRDNTGPISHYVGHFQDISEARRAQAHIEFQAHYDALTALPNRWMLSERLTQDISRCRRHGHHGAVLFIDLDHFKRINDALGHRVGDALLKAVAQRLLDNTRQEDLAARFGGDEFIIVLTELDADPAQAAEQAQRTADKLRAALAVPYVHDDNHLHLSASVGIALYPRDQADAETILTHADIALYHVKEQGRNGQAIYQPRMQDTLRARLDTENALRLALQNDEFELIYQPQVDADGRTLGVEALLRWHRPGQGLVMPDAFIPIAEDDSALILPIGDWTLRTACASLARWRKILPAQQLPTLSLNVSPRQFFQANFVERVLSHLDANGIDGSALELELTEGVLLNDFAEVRHKMHELAARGVRFALDDFGTGYSSLRYLQQLPIATLKIDRSFVRGLEAESGNAAIIRSIVSVARHLNLGVVAEGVETAAEAQLLIALGCSIHQGYRHSRPLNEADYLAWLGSEPHIPS